MTTIRHDLPPPARMLLIMVSTRVDCGGARRTEMRLARQRILPLSLILVMILTVVSCVRNTYLTKFDSVAEYWSSTVNPDLDPSKIAHLMIPFVNSNGIHFLLLKMEVLLILLLSFGILYKSELIM